MPPVFSRKTIQALPALKNLLWSRAARRFIADQAKRGVTLRDAETPARLAAIDTLAIDETLVMEGWEAVRMAAAPLAACDLSRFRRQGSWMMLTAAVALGCDGIAPLEAFAREMGFDRARMGRQYPRAEEAFPASSPARETTLHHDAEGMRAFTRGAPEAILPLCDRVLDGRERPMTDEDRAAAAATAAGMEREGLSVLAFATTWRSTPGDYEKEMVFLGLLGTGDLPAEETPQTLATLRACGVRPVLLAAPAISAGALSAGSILPPNRRVLSGEEIDALDDDAFAGAALDANAFVGLRAAHRRRALRVLRASGSLAVVAHGTDGALLLQASGTDAPDALLPRGGLAAVAELLSACRALAQSLA